MHFYQIIQTDGYEKEDVWVYNARSYSPEEFSSFCKQVRQKIGKNASHVSVAIALGQFGFGLVEGTVKVVIKKKMFGSSSALYNASFGKKQKGEKIAEE